MIIYANFEHIILAKLGKQLIRCVMTGVPEIGELTAQRSMVQCLIILPLRLAIAYKILYYKFEIQRETKYDTISDNTKPLGGYTCMLIDYQFIIRDKYCLWYIHMYMYRNVRFSYLYASGVCYEYAPDRVSCEETSLRFSFHPTSMLHYR